MLLLLGAAVIVENLLLLPLRERVMSIDFAGGLSLEKMQPALLLPRQGSGRLGRKASMQVQV